MKGGVRPSLTMISLALGMGWAAANHADTGPQPGTLRAVTFSHLTSGDELFLHLEGADSFRKVQAGEDAVYVDLKSVKMAGVALSLRLHNLPGASLTGYRLQPYLGAGRQAAVRVPLATKHPELFAARALPEAAAGAATLPAQQDSGFRIQDSAKVAEAAKISARASEATFAASSSPGNLQSHPSYPAEGAPARRSETAATEQPKYTGEKISLNLKDVDLKDFFRLIHEVSGLNVMVDPNVTGTLTLVMDQVPWDQALDLVLRTNGLAKVLESNVLRIARSATLATEGENALRLADLEAEATPLVTVYRPVNYAKATTLAALLKSWVGGGALSKRGNVLVDERTNMLIISDIATRMPIIESVVTKLDKKSSQISIEARIVRANSDFARSLSTVLSVAQSNPSGSVQGAGATGTGITGTAHTGPPLPPSSLFTQPPSASATGFGVYAITNASSRYLISAAIAAAETRDQAKVISAPTIVTQNNVAGTVLQGTKIPVQTVINNTVTTVYVDATLTLKVTPQVTDDGNIFLDLNVQNASPGAVLSSGAPAPSINTQQATTQVLVPDGGTVVFGGVKVTNRTRAVTQVPILGSIPILGNLFKSSNVTDNDQELLFFVTPKVMPR